MNVARECRAGVVDRLVGQSLMQEFLELVDD